METTVRIVGFGASPVSEVLDSAENASIDCIEIPDLSDFSHGEIDWRGRLEGAHWLVLSTSTVLAGDSARCAQGASMTFAEFEGPRTVMVTDIPSDPSRLSEAWGFVIERIRQIHMLFFTKSALSAIAEIEEMEESELLHEIRLRGMTPQVIAFEPSENKVTIEHSLGNYAGTPKAEIASQWLGQYLCELPLQGPGAEGIKTAANRC
ncbi:MAG: hypothetical protein VYB30_02520 [Candidatus Thermoplasmatota archaeon]|nr:hypothetical protein [Candidatus Thermoplasmatota archaeon]